MFAGLLACSIFLAASASADSPTSVSMYGSWINEDVRGRESEFGNLGPLEAWTTIDLRRSRWTRVVSTFAVEDEDKVVRLHDFYARRIARRPWLAPWLSDLVAGYFIPPFGREWSGLNPFQIGTVRYAGISDSMVARDAGVQLNLAPVRSFSATCAVFLDNRRGGYSDEIGNTHRHFYFRIRRPLPFRVVAGASWRWSTLDRTPWLVELTRESERGLYAFELLRAEGMSQWYALAERDIRYRTPEQEGRLRAAARFERVRGGERLTLGCSVFALETVTAKANVVFEWFGGPVTQKLLLQAIIHFSP